MIEVNTFSSEVHIAPRSLPRSVFSIFFCIASRKRTVTSACSWLATPKASICVACWYSSQRNFFSGTFVCRSKKHATRRWRCSRESTEQQTAAHRCAESVAAFSSETKKNLTTGSSMRWSAPSADMFSRTSAAVLKR